MELRPLTRRTLKAGQTRYPSRDIDDNHNLIGHDRQTEHVAPTFDDNIDVLTSCRDGPVHAGFKVFGMHELPEFRHLTNPWLSE